MRIIRGFGRLPYLTLIAFYAAAPLYSAALPGKVSADWGRTIRESKTSISLSVCVEPPMRRGSPIHGQLLKALRDLNAAYLRFQTWRPYPRIAVAELKPPQNGKTSWDFSLLDPILIDFMEAAAGRPVVMNISTIPQWMFKTPKPVPYPADPNEIDWIYGADKTDIVGTELRDATMKEVADYFARVVSWYTQGGFKDEYGQWHQSGHHFKFDYWEVLNEVEYEHRMTPQFYTALYDSIVTEVRKVAPEMKFMGLALGPSGPLRLPEYFEYFLNPKNHKPGIPLDAISYHFYATAAPDETPDIMQYTSFAQADRFINAVRFVELIRQRLSPDTRTHINEIGTILPDSRAPMLVRPIPHSYWNLSGAMYAYLYAHLALMGVDVAHESELIDYPSQYAGTTVVDWVTGRPNARYWVLKLLRDNFGPGDKLVETQLSIPAPPDAGDSPSPRDYVLAKGFFTRDGKRKILLVNKRDQSFEISIPGRGGARVDYVDQTTGFDPPATLMLKNDQLTLKGYGVAVVLLAQ